MTSSPALYDLFRRDRLEEVTADRGALALVKTHWSDPGAELISDDDALSDQPDGASLTRLSRPSIDTGEIQHGYRVWLPASPARRAFQGIDAYPFDEVWEISARFELVASDRLVPFEHIKDAGATRSHGAAGDVVFSLAGAEYRLAAFNADDADVVQLVFADTTNGAETYGSGRFLFVTLPAAWRELSDGESVPVTVDFNEAVVPPCGFSSQMNCPLPPASNRLPFAVTAGEKTVTFADGFELY